MVGFNRATLLFLCILSFASITSPMDRDGTGQTDDERSEAVQVEQRSVLQSLIDHFRLATTDDVQHEVGQATRQLTQSLDAEKERLDAKITDLFTQLDTLEQAQKPHPEAIKKLRESLDKELEKRTALQERMDSLAERVDVATAEIREAREGIDKHIKQITALTALLSSLGNN